MTRCLHHTDINYFYFSQFWCIQFHSIFVQKEKDETEIDPLNLSYLSWPCQLARCFERSLLSSSGGNAIKHNRTIALHCQGGMGRTVKLTTAGDGPCNLKWARASFERERLSFKHWDNQKATPPFIVRGQIPSYTPKAVPVLGIDVSIKLLSLQSDVC